MSQVSNKDDFVKEWFGQLPEGWLLRRLRTLGRFTSSGIDKKTVEGEAIVKMVNYTDVYGNPSFELRNSPDYMIVTCPVDKTEEHGLIKGDILFTPSSETKDDIGVSAVVMEDLPNTVYSYHITRFRMKDGISVNYRKYFCNHSSVLRQFSRLCQGTTRQILVRDNFKSAWVAIPPPGEDERIAAYLDEQTAKIDRLMEMRRRQMALLKKQRAAVIQQAVTRGLNPAAPLKDSGLPWLGEIPAHWEVKEIRRLVPQNRQVMYGIVLPGPNVDEGVPIVKAGNCEPGRLSIEYIHRTTYEIEAGYERSRLRSGDIVYAIRGSFGEAEIVPPELEGANLTQDAARISPRKGIHNRWFWYAVRARSFFSQMDSVAVGATIRGVNIRDLKRGKVAVPPIKEQEQIADFIDKKNAKFDSIHKAYARQLALLSEYRAALIHECVTGRRRVAPAAGLAAESA